MTVYVIMGNDFPAAVYDNRAAANAHCERENAKNEERLRDGYGRIYWRVYEFPLQAAR